MLVGYDGSEAANAAIGAAGRLLAPREVVIETVWIPYTGVAAGGVVGAPVAVASRATQELDSIAVTRSEQTAREGARIAADAGLEARPRRLGRRPRVEHDPRQRRGSREAPAISWARGRGSMSSAVLGSTSAALVHHVRLPMLVVPRNQLRLVRADP